MRPIFKSNQFEVSQLALVTNVGDWTFKIGKFVTPFGRTYFPLYSNAEWDAPFIRTEVIGWRETGVLAHYKSGCFVGDIALTNGGENLATNSSKVLMTRVGMESDWWAIGCSAKQGNGIGSENEKEFDNYFGVDMMFRNGPFQLSSECVFDEYGFGRPNMNPLKITWVKSIYYRDISSGQQGVPCTGVGYYVNLGYADGPWNATLDYGDFYPLYTGTAPNQRVQHRGLAKAAYRIREPLQVFSVVIVENGGYIAQSNEGRPSRSPCWKDSSSPSDPPLECGGLPPLSIPAGCTSGNSTSDGYPRVLKSGGKPPHSKFIYTSRTPAAGP